MKYFTFLIFAICLIATSAFAQKELPVIGQISDLHSPHNVYLDAPTTAVRKSIEKIIVKDKSFEIAADASKADFILEFKQISQSAPQSYGQAKHDEMAEMTAYFYNTENKKIVVWSMTRSIYEKKGFGLPKSNETELIKAFLKSLKEFHSATGK